MAATTIVFVGLLAVLTAMLLVTLMPSDCSVAQVTTEGFQPLPSDSLQCPPGTSSVITRDGNTVCCRGVVNGRSCEGELVCRLSEAPNTLIHCSQLPPPVLPGFGDLGPPVRNVTVTDDEIRNSNKLLNNLERYIKMAYALALFRAQPCTETKCKGLKTTMSEINRISTLGDSLANWRKMYGSRATNIQKAKEFKYTFDQLFELPAMQRSVSPSPTRVAKALIRRLLNLDPIQTQDWDNKTRDLLERLRKSFKIQVRLPGMPRLPKMPSLPTCRMG
jgi:hypothetical protein